ncbi:thiol-disulfide oxidoreductase [Burkholderia pseudomultivorans]|uniref:Thiol-disulfide oxidoreductase n=1 Tax=Burkholderia pseudomultivorans TaxID=1207504 RepID=A0A6P2L1A2_9BURK|nr:DUF393 domain-containing protein [Burkholderia pseudomultivorans]VWB64618.1 thiol-disulfide oxidoreductase [Burkholderia pseudomultivorans]
MKADQLVLYFDGRCPLCVEQVRRLGASDTQRRLAFVDIAGPGFDPAPPGVDRAALNRELHGRLPDGRIVAGVDAILTAYALAGRRWLVWPLRVPGMRSALAVLYRCVARNRHVLSRWLGYRAAEACDSTGCTCGADRTGARIHEHDRARRVAVSWMVGAAIVHLLVGAALPWIAGSPLLDGYHIGIERHFWAAAAPVPARLQQLWWMSLLGATLQCLSIWMLALVHLGNRLRRRAVWGWLLAGLLVWAPQDLMMSWHAGIGINIAADVAALAALVPPLVWLWRRDAA